MHAHEVASLHDSMRRYGIPGKLTPLNPADPNGPWHVIDDTTPDHPRDITTATLAAIAAAHRRQPTRGFTTT
ncbi:MULTISPECIES: hypothetical protein [unclassified Streptomyces]|uniref:hypothetical protein n=1 Tax=Streptomyces sp. NPDC048330 TaxID=3365533 RepID=UPI0037211360